MERGERTHGETVEEDWDDINLGMKQQKYLKINALKPVKLCRRLFASVIASDDQEEVNENTEIVDDREEGNFSKLALPGHPIFCLSFRPASAQVVLPSSSKGYSMRGQQPKMEAITRRETPGGEGGEVKKKMRLLCPIIFPKRDPQRFQPVLDENLDRSASIKVENGGGFFFEDDWFGGGERGRGSIGTLVIDTLFVKIKKNLISRHSCVFSLL